MKFKIFILIPCACLLSKILCAQNIGIGTSNPSKRLSINGSIAIDQGSTNYGTLDSAALVFGTNSLAGISSKKTGETGINGLDFWAGGAKRMTINQQGNIGINATPDLVYRFRVDGFSRFHSPTYFDSEANIYGHLYVADYAGMGGSADSNYTLRVYGSKPSRFGGNLETIGNLSIGGSLDDNYRLRVIGGNSRFGGDAQVTGRMAIGGDMDNNFRLRVYDGNSRFGGNVEVTGQINTASMNVDALAIAGKGSVRSDGLSPLRIGFSSRYVDVVIAGGATHEYTVNIPDFTGDNDDIRVSVSQFAPAAGGDPLAFERTVISLTNVNAADGTVRMKLHNTANGQLYLKGTVYFMAVAKN
ncbi:MAG: hypothetical protein H7Y86_14300 [Rhizobacter sp.]|nr:hypothetical protein [Ferruginibacter sp.]